MLLLVAGGFASLLALPFLVRGWIFTLAPDRPISQRARERNLRLGLEPDIRVWGRKVRRFGLLLLLGGLALGAWGWTLVGAPS
jgi:hypothetical protein